MAAYRQCYCHSMSWRRCYRWENVVFWWKSFQFSNFLLIFLFNFPDLIQCFGAHARSPRLSCHRFGSSLHCDFLCVGQSKVYNNVTFTTVKEYFPGNSTVYFSLTNCSVTLPARLWFSSRKYSTQGERSFMFCSSFKSGKRSECPLVYIAIL